MKAKIGNFVRSKSFHDLTVILSVMSFAISLALPAFVIGKDSFESYLLVFLGWLGVTIYGSILPSIIWLANPIYLFSLWVSVKERLAGLLLSLTSLLLAYLFLIQNSLPLNMSDSFPEITSYGWGYRLWLLSFLILSLGNFLRILFKNSETEVAS